MQTSICVSNISLNILKFLNFLKIRPNPTWSDLIRPGPQSGPTFIPACFCLNGLYHNGLIYSFCLNGLYHNGQIYSFCLNGLYHKGQIYSIVFALNGLYHNGQINDIFCLNGIYYNGYRMLLFCPTTMGRLFIVSLFCVTEGFTGVVVVFACTTCGIFNTCVDHRITYLVRNMFVYNLKH